MCKVKIMRVLFYILLLLINIVVKAQDAGQLMAMNTNNGTKIVKETPKKQFSGSESSEYAFIVNSNVKENTILIKTNYTGEYKIRFIDYYGGSRKVFKDVYSNKLIDISEFEKAIFIMNIIDSKSNKLLSSQVVNLKRRHL